MANPLSTFKAPIPGSSLTSEFGTLPHQRPPEITDVEEAKEYVWREINRKEILHSIWHLAENGMPAMNIALMILYKASMYSIFTPDVAVLIADTVTSMVEVICREQDIDIKRKPKIKTATDALFEADALREISASRKTAPKEEVVPPMPAYGAPAAEPTTKPKGLMNAMMSGEQ